MNDYYVYEWIRLDTNEPFYVGKGKGNRWKDLIRGRNYHSNNIVNKIPVAVNILHDNLDEETAYGLEVWYIREYRDIIGYDLCNINDGGEGCALCGELNGMYGKKGKDAPMYGVHRYGEDAPSYGKHHTEEAKIKISTALKGKKKSVDTIEKRRKSITGKYIGKNSWNKRAIICLTTNKIFYLMEDALKYYNLKSAGELSTCCKGYRKRKGKI